MLKTFFIFVITFLMANQMSDWQHWLSNYHFEEFIPFISGKFYSALAFVPNRQVFFYTLGRL